MPPLTTPPPGPAVPAPPGAPRPVYTGTDCTVTQYARGETVILSFVGACSPALREWLPRGLRMASASVALKLRNLVKIDTPFVREILFFARESGKRGRVVALIDPPERVIEVLDLLGAGKSVEVVGTEEALPEKGSLHEHLRKEQQALEEIAGWLASNPLWRRADREHMWLCPLCGVLQEDVKILNLVTPGAAAARGVRRHLVERCVAWRAGGRTPLAASLLDARVQQINDRKAASTAERSFILTKQVEGLQERVDELDHLERDVRKAQRRQMHLLPIDPEPDEIADVAVAYRPAQAIGGDFLDFYSLEDNRFGVVIGDVSGHGVEAAILMGIAKKALRIRVQETVTGREAMEHANRDLHQELRSTAFVTAFFAGIDRSDRRMRYVRAGHPPPLLRRAAGGCEELGSGGLPLGVDGGRRFNGAVDEKEVELFPGDILLLYTDGVIEAGASAHEFGSQRLRDAFMAVPAGDPADKIVRTLMSAVDQFLGGAPQDDDVTMICLKIK